MTDLVANSSTVRHIGYEQELWLGAIETCENIGWNYILQKCLKLFEIVCEVARDGHRCVKHELLCARDVSHQTTKQLLTNRS